MRYFIHLGFDGTDYSGWQRQNSTQNTVQEALEQTLFKLFKKRISVYGCGRTDAGVHASQYVIDINLDEPPNFDLKFRLNKNLPNSIAVFEIFEVNEDQYARYGAVSRTYDYFIHWKKNPILFHNSSFYENLKLDFELMKKAAVLIRETKDFKALCKQPHLYDNTLCEVSNCELFIDEALGRMRFTITGSRFLRGMVRICVYYLLEVGRCKMTVAEFTEILNLKKELKIKYSAHPNGLFLSKVEYPFLKLDDSYNLVKILSVGLE
ncbi:tRNA pseudouridine synthase A [Tenacibaculum sp. HL-MS23]|uniref:tRNA pseudouridine synthase A n=1 Tax=Tenacibaculum sp. HL-MS23 TaxID=3077734 RepID=UPI0028FC15DF|nr:tRNA pseudouridine synthase A [Tenacibaculum sp. HL-MS23]WNW00775.1 tRNA pseudouridine synthase A [Tenacibaculum sp. HL-MS23]